MKNTFYGSGLKFKVLLVSLLLHCSTQGQSIVSSDSLRKPFSEDWFAQIKWKNGYVNCNMSLQMWNVLTLDYNNLESDPRYDLYLRRGRLGFGGKIFGRLLFGTTFSYDGAGKNQFTQSLGGLNNDERFQMILRDGFISYSFSQLFNLTMGFFRPRVGKESFNSSWFCISQEKSLPNIQVRRHMVGRILGRETGVNLGGIHLYNSRVGFGYDVGLFDLNHPAVAGDDSIGNLLKTGRVFVMFGDAEVQQYSLIYLQSGFGQRKGVTIGFNASHQSGNNKFKYNSVVGADIQLNWGPLDIILEQDWLIRSNRVTNANDIRTVDIVNSAKAAWNFQLKNNTIVQPTVMFTSENAEDILASENNLTNSIDQHVFAVGVNWLLNKDRLKLGIHYTGGKIESQDDYSFINTSVQFML